jgi:hypothetical protein
MTDVELFDVNADVINATKDYGPFFCAPYSYFAISVTCPTGRMRYQLLFSKDNPATKFIAKSVMIAPQGGPSTLIFPVLGTYFTIRVDGAVFPSTNTMYGFIVPTASALVGSLGLDTLFTSGGFFTIAAGTNSTFLFSHMFAGEASVWTHTQGAAAFIELGVLDLAGGFTQIDVGSNTGAGMPKNTNFNVMIPPRPLSVVCHNLGAAVAEFAFAISGRPLWGGS